MIQDSYYTLTRIVLAEVCMIRCTESSEGFMEM